MPRAIWRPPLLAVLVAACSTMIAPTPVPTPTPPPPTATPGLIAATFAPPPTPEPTEDFNNLPPTTTTGWWGDPDKPSECLQPGSYRIGYRVAALGDCAGMFNEGPPSITLDVGEDFDLHMTIRADGEQPIWPLPVAEDELVALGWLIFDDATMTYRALSPGSTQLVTKGACFRGTPTANPPLGDADDTCPLLVIHVRDIETKCVKLAADLCRAAGAAGVGQASVAPGQRIVGWVAEPASLKIEWPGCGTVVAKVTLELRDPEGQVSVTLGQPDPSAHPLGLAECTY